MSDTKHTPKPWKFLRAFGRIETDQRVICYMAAGVTERALKETLENGKLIAAAPDLLEALQAMIRYGEDGPAKGETGYDIEMKAKAAIRKAKGE